MNPTFYQMDLLNAPAGMVAALLIGIGFGVCLEIGGFGSSKILSGVFYFRDLRVVKVMMSALFTAMLGLLLLQKTGVIAPGSIHILPTFYLAAAIGGLLFGIGFAAGGWCPGTAAVGLVSGKIDAGIFLLGSMIGVGIFAGVFPWVQNIYAIGNAGTPTLLLHGDSRWLVSGFVLGGIAILMLAESWDPEAWRCRFRRIPENRGLLALCGFLIVALTLYLWIEPVPPNHRLADISVAADHMESHELADALRNAEPDLFVADLRSAEEFRSGHIPGARHLPLTELEPGLRPYRNHGRIVLYSNGMTHPAQAREILYQQGFRNVKILTDGFAGFRNEIAKPLSLRLGPVSPEDRARFEWWNSAQQVQLQEAP